VRDHVRNLFKFSFLDRKENLIKVEFKIYFSAKEIKLRWCETFGINDKPVLSFPNTYRAPSTH
jgi:hypothetical protein